MIQIAMSWEPISMAMRHKIWFAGLVLSSLVVIGLCLDGASGNLILPSLILMLGLTAWFVEVASIRTLDPKRNRHRFPERARPADGLVEVTQTSDIEGKSNSTDPSYRRFISLSDRAENSAHPVETTTCLLGRVVIISVFVGRDATGWSDQEIAIGLDSTRTAAIWIERQAIRYAAPVNLSLADVYFSMVDDVEDLVELSFQPEGDDFGPMEANASTKAVTMASRISSQMGFVDVADWMTRINMRFDVDATTWLFHLQSAGRSMAIGPELSGMNEVSFAVCYAKETSFPESLEGRPRVDSTTVAHEMLHQFGALDKYGTELKAFPKRSVTSRDIMRLNHNSLNRMTIDPLTAEEIGWNGYEWLEQSTKNPPATQ